MNEGVYQIECVSILLIGLEKSTSHQQRLFTTRRLSVLVFYVRHVALNLNEKI